MLVTSAMCSRYGLLILAGVASHSIAFCATAIQNVETTPQQAVISVSTDQSGYCTYHVSRGDSLFSDIPDLTHNGNSDGRLGSIMSYSPQAQPGTSLHKFVVGARHGDDSLASDAAYTVSVSCGSDGPVTGSFKTQPIQWDATYPSPIPFRRSQFGNMDYPTIDWNNPQQSYIDPTTGAEYWRISSAGTMNAWVQRNNRVAVVDDLSNGKWIGAQNIGSGSSCLRGTCAQATGGASDALFIPMAPVACNQGGHFSEFKYSLNACTVDDVMVDVYCGAASEGGVSITLQWSLDHGKTVIGNPIQTATCPTGSVVKIGTYPNASPKPIWQNWGLSPQRYRIWPVSGTANVSGQQMTAQTGYFWTDSEMGDRILINGQYFDIASVVSPGSITLKQSLSLTGANWQSAGSGLVITKTGPANSTLNVAINVNVAFSQVVDPSVDGNDSLFNWVPVTVGRDADGNRIPNPLVGYLGALTGTGGQLQPVLWIPYNPDGTVRNETRPIAQTCKNPKSATFHGAGDTFTSSCVLVSSIPARVFDNTDGNTWYGNDAAGRLFRMTYDESLPGCAGFPAYRASLTNGTYQEDIGRDDCFQWYNLTPASAGKYPDTQVIAAYQTGKNAAGETVGDAHTNFDLGWMQRFSWDLVAANYMIGHKANDREHLAIIAAFDTKSGIVKWVRDSWSGPTSFSTGGVAGRWAGFHSCPYSFQTWFWCATNPLSGTGSQTVFGNRFSMAVSAINRAGFGQQPRWDCPTCDGPKRSAGLAWNEAYTCPQADALAPGYASFAGTANCVQIRIKTPPCNMTPSTTYKFPDGKLEKDEFPCSTPGFGIANPTASKLQDLIQGDWLSASSGWERLVILTPPSYNGTNNITFWALRWALTNVVDPIFNDTTDNDKGTASVYGDGWSLYTAPSYSTNGASLMATLSGNSDWQPDNPMRINCHASIGGGTRPNTASWVSTGCYGNVAEFNMTPAILNPVQHFGATPTFNGLTGFSSLQSYPSVSYAPGTTAIPVIADFRHLNGAGGTGPELSGQIIGPAVDMTPVAGTSKSYKLMSRPDWLSTYKILPLHGWAGRFLLRDLSGPTTGNSMDLPDFSFCFALNSNECFQASVPGDVFVTVPAASRKANCWADQLTYPVPCVVQLGPLTGSVVELRGDAGSAPGIRRLGYNHGLPGSQYEFTNCRYTPVPDFVTCFGNWLDGVRNEWLAIRVKSRPAPDGVKRDRFIQIQKNVPGVPSASSVRIRFGYAEYGSNSMDTFPYRCSAYASACSTDTPINRPSDPYSFTSEPSVHQPCLDGTTCQVIIPAISGRMVYYVVEYFDSGGNLVSSSPVDVIAAP